MNDRHDPSRRNFLLAMGRYGLTLILGGGVWLLASRDPAECQDPGLCRPCAAFDGCELPNAVLARQSAVAGDKPRRATNGPTEGNRE